MNHSVQPQPIAVALGDPAGVGPEIVAKCWDQRERWRLPPFFAIGDMRSLNAVWGGPVAIVEDPREVAAAFELGLPLLSVAAAEADVPGRPSLAGAHCSYDSLELGVGLTRSSSVSALVTGPVSKEQLYAIGFSHPGQTEFIAERCGVSSINVAMMLAGPTLRTVPVTTHVAFADVPGQLSAGLIEARGRTALRGLQRNFGIAEPRLAVAALNPHGGEGGLLGREEIDMIVPAIEALLAEGWLVTGPHSADSMFHATARACFDAALCQYHDQALIPLKALHFEDGVNTTLGLPIIRTSPDHGTAFDIAGSNRADPRAMAAAIRMAAQCAAMRDTAQARLCA